MPFVCCMISFRFHVSDARSFVGCVPFEFADLCCAIASNNTLQIHVLGALRSIMCCTSFSSWTKFEIAMHWGILWTLENRRLYSEKHLTLVAIRGRAPLFTLLYFLSQHEFFFTLSSYLFSFCWRRQKEKIDDFNQNLQKNCGKSGREREEEKWTERHTFFGYRFCQRTRWRLLARECRTFPMTISTGTQFILICRQIIMIERRNSRNQGKSSNRR